VLGAHAKIATPMLESTEGRARGNDDRPPGAAHVRQPKKDGAYPLARVGPKSVSWMIRKPDSVFLRQAQDGQRREATIPLGTRLPAHSSNRTRKLLNGAFSWRIASSACAPSARLADVSLFDLAPRRV
jgi:hypothetical protein